MSGRVYYNEIDARAAAWLRELMRASVIPDGEIDTRSIVDVRAADLVGFRQCHFFAGIGGWAYALQLAGWPADRECWTGSCPCQPWSMAGRGEGASDSRHLWPAWFGLIGERRPQTLFGEQVASADGLYWLDLVFVDLEGAGYAVAPFDLPACGVGAPHRRSRLWIVADADRRGQRATGRAARETRQSQQRGETRAVVMGAADDARREGDRLQPIQRARDRSRPLAGATGSSPIDRLGDAERSGLEGLGGHGDDGDQPGWFGAHAHGSTPASGPTNGFWRAAAWIACTDGKARPIEPGTFPLADGIPARVGRLRGYGNAIVPQVAAEVISAYMEAREG